MTRRLLGILSALVLAIGVTAPAKADTTKLTIGHGFASDCVSIYVAKNQGFFDKHGIDATLQPIGNPQTLLTGLFSGSLQIIMSSPAQFLTAVNGGLDFVVIAGGSRLNKANDPIGLMLRADVPYTQPSDLKGLTIGVPGFNSGTFMLLKAWLVSKHVDPADVHFVEVTMPTEDDLLKSKKADGVLAAEPFRSQIVASGSGKVVAKFYTEVIPDQAAIFWVATRAWATAHPDLVAAFRASLADAGTWATAHPTETAGIEKQAFGADTPANFDGRVTAQDLTAYYTIGKQLGMFTKPIDVTTLIVH